MLKFDWQRQQLERAVQREPTPDASRIVLWLPVTDQGGARQWERISNVPGAPVTEEAGLAATAATVVRAQRSGGGLFSMLFGRHRRSEAPTWILPSGASVRQIGE